MIRPLNLPQNIGTIEIPTCDCAHSADIKGEKQSKSMKICTNLKIKVFKEENIMENTQNSVTTTTINEMEENTMVNEHNTIAIETANENERNDNKTNELKVIKPKSKSKARGAKSANGVCTVVNSEKNGKRVTLSKEIMELLNNPVSIEIGFTEDGIAVAKKLPENGVEFSLRKNGNKGVIYSSQLVEEITELFDLDFQDRVSITFTEAEEVNDDSDNLLIKILTK
jgi:hypothetical protein